MTQFTRAAFMLAILAIVGATVFAIPARAASFSFAVYGTGSPALKIEISADSFRETRDLGANGRTTFAVPGPPKVIYYWIEGCGVKRGGSYTVNGTVAARLDIDKNCAGSVYSNQDNLK
jgi:hypothetical protein